jgi:hypothetical protein
MDGFGHARGERLVQVIHCIAHDEIFPQRSAVEQTQTSRLSTITDGLAPHLYRFKF